MKVQQLLPEISAEAVGRRGCSFPSGVSLVEIILDHLQEGQRDLTPRRLGRNDTERCICAFQFSVILLYRPDFYGLNEDSHVKQGNGEDVEPL